MDTTQKGKTVCTASLIDCHTGAQGKKNMGVCCASLWEMPRVWLLLAKSTYQFGPVATYKTWPPEVLTKIPSIYTGATRLRPTLWPRQSASHAVEENGTVRGKRKTKPKIAQTFGQIFAWKEDFYTHTQTLWASEILNARKFPDTWLHLSFLQADSLNILTVLIFSWWFSSDWKLGEDKSSAHDISPHPPLICLPYWAFGP